MKKNVGKRVILNNKKPKPTSRKEHQRRGCTKRPIRRGTPFVSIKHTLRGGRTRALNIKST